MNVSIFCYSESGSHIAKDLCDMFGLSYKSVHSIEKFASKYGFVSHKSISSDIEPFFNAGGALIFIGACGIAVRTIAPYVKSKTTDPAVIVIDDQKKFIIPILSGHIGGANELTRKLAEKTGSLAVITTATDGASRFSCDTWAFTHNCALSSMKTAKDVSAAILENDIPVSSEFLLSKSLPSGLFPGNNGETGIYIGIKKASPYSNTLRIIPRVLTVGIGCRKGAKKEDISCAVRAVFEKAGLDLKAVKSIASIDVKKNEEGLLFFADELNIPAVFFSADELNSVKGDFEDSEFVKKTVGTGNVCERSAALAGGRIIIKKTVENSVTIAVAQSDWEVIF